MLWFSSMITRILRGPLSTAAGVLVAPVAGALARPVPGVARGPGAESELGAEVELGPEVELQPAARRHPARPKAASHARLAGRMPPSGVSAWSITRPTLDHWPAWRERRAGAADGQFGAADLGNRVAGRVSGRRPPYQGHRVGTPVYAGLPRGQHM